MSGDQTKFGSGRSNSATAFADAAALDGTATAARPKGRAGWGSWSNLWQGPSIIAGVALIVLGVYAAAVPAADKVDRILLQVEQSLAGGELTAAADQIRRISARNLASSPPIQQARFHATAADLMAKSQQARRTRTKATDRLICDHYAESARLGRSLQWAQLERWAGSLLELGDLQGAYSCLSELDAMKSADAEASRERVLRKFVDRSLKEPEFFYDQTLQLLIDYRARERRSAVDEVWAVSNQARLQLDTGRPQEAVDLLLVEMRRLESQESWSGALNWAELSLLLGRGYFELGDNAKAEAHLQRVLAQTDHSEPVCGEAIVILGEIAIARNEFDLALEKFDLVARDFPGLPCYLPGVLGRAHVQSILGDHEASLADYAFLCEQTSMSAPRRDLSPGRIAASLCDRHDAAIALGKFEEAFDYVVIAEELFAREQVPSDVLLRLASINYQIAVELSGREVDGQSAHYQQAGDYYLRNYTLQAQAESSQRGDAAASLWMAADSYDHAGLQDQSIEHFLKYLGSQPLNDPRRGEGLFRAAQAYQAKMEYSHAILYYEQVVADRARSAFAAHSYVPLARCYVAVGRRPEAKQLLGQVLAGDRLLGPEAADYRDALIELGRIHYESDEYVAAIEVFDQAVQRYPNDPSRLEVAFLLADSFRNHAMQLDQEIKEEPAPMRSEQERLKAIRTDHWQRAEELFDVICESDGSFGASGLDEFGMNLVRSAWFYRADCEFHLGRYDQAAELYELAAQQYKEDHNALYALIQIVNCYSALGDRSRSAQAHQRALARLHKLPDGTLATPDSLMDRSAWERWLENNPPHS